MRISWWLLLAFTGVLVPASRAEFSGPTDAKAQKTFAEASDKGTHETLLDRLDRYKKADKQDGNHCGTCKLAIIQIAMKVDPKLAREKAIELESLAATPDDQSLAAFRHGQACVRLGLLENKPAYLTEADAALQHVIALDRKEKSAAFVDDGIALANLRLDDRAKVQFEHFLETAKPGTPDYGRAARYAHNPELARERIAPAFSLVALNGERVSVDDLQGKVVLVDFWATWCPSCVNALPQIQGIAKRFAGQPLVVLSVSLDKDDAKWREFVAKNHMDWLQYRDGAAGPLARAFGVHVIPATFTIDPEGIVQDARVGDANIESKLKKLVHAASANAERPQSAGN